MPLQPVTTRPGLWRDLFGVKGGGSHIGRCVRHLQQALAHLADLPRKRAHDLMRGKGLTGFKGHSYQLQRCDELPGPWQDISPAQTGEDAPITFIDPAGASAPRRFYRVSVSP